MTTKSRQRTTDGSAPDLLTVEEAARILWIGRTKTYELARRWLKTGGAEGLPAVRVGHQLRVRRCGVEAGYRSSRGGSAIIGRARWCRSRAAPLPRGRSYG